MTATAPRPVPPQAPAIRCDSYGLKLQPAPWRFTLLHDRPDDVLLWVTRGQGRVIVNGVRRGISMNTALYLPAGTLFSVDLAPQAQALLVECPGGRVGILPKTALLLRVRDSLSQAELTGEIDAMTRETQRGRAYLDDALEAHMRLIAVWLHRQTAGGAGEEPPDSAAHRLARRYAQAVVRSYAGPHPMGAFAEALDVTPTHLTRACRAACGRTAAEILTERRLHAARDLLETGTPSIKEIAQRLGFASPAYFTRFIRNHTGASPSELRFRARTRPARA